MTYDADRLDTAVRRLLDRQAIHDVILTMMRAIDRLDWELLAECYHPGAVETHGVYDGTAEDFMAFGKDFITVFPMTMHTIMNSLVEFLDDDTAVAESYGIGYHRRPVDAEGPTQGEEDLTVGFRYVDRFERRDGSWKLAHRKMVFEWSREDPVGRTLKMQPNFLRGVRGPEDPLYSFGVSRGAGQGRTTTSSNGVPGS